MSLSAALTELLAPPADEPQAAPALVVRPPSGWSPQAEWDDESATIVSEAWQAGQPEPAEAAMLAERGLDPETWMVERVRHGEWQQSKRLEGGHRDTITLYSKRVSFVRRGLAGSRIKTEHLVDQLRTRRRKAPPSARTDTPLAFVHAGGDYQLGKLDGDGVDGTVDRFMAALETGPQLLAEHRRRQDVGPIYLPHLGDCIEGYVSQGGRNALSTGLPLVEQVDLLIHLLVEQVRVYAPLTDRLVVPVIPGNHDEALRTPVSGLEHDSWSTFAAKQLRRALSLAGKQYDHVRIVAPPRGELTLTLDMCGTPVGMAHGHKWSPGKAHDWWDGQHHGMQAIGDARLLLSAHSHHLRLEQSGIKTSLQVPALEGESRWWRHRKGQQSPPGMVTMLVGEAAGRPLTLPDGRTLRTGWSNLEVA